MLRYKENGELHKDFHTCTNATIDYVIKNFGEDVLNEIFKNTAQKVYKSIHEKLKNDDTSELLEYLKYFLERENADFKITNNDDEIILTLHKCPAISHLKKLGRSISPNFCLQTKKINEYFCEGTPWMSETEKTSECSCIQTFRRKK